MNDEPLFLPFYLTPRYYSYPRFFISSVFVVFLITRNYINRPLNTALHHAIHSLLNTFPSPSQGDVTTTMLWINGQISALPTITGLFLPSLVSVLLSIGSLLIFDFCEGCDEKFLIKDISTVLTSSYLMDLGS